MTTITAGYDAGGAHLKVARAENGRITAAAEFPCPLWNGIESLDAALDLADEITRGAHHHAVTMTGELCELFPSRHDGVVRITRHFADRLGDSTRFYCGLKGFGDTAAALADTTSVGSANFLATAQVIARTRAKALLIDMGSTTTDIVACDRPQGLTDAERLQTGELVYTGFTRTPVPSVTTRGVLAGQWQTLARDVFATMADVRRLLGELPDDIAADTASDGRGASIEESLTRLARGFGRDAEMRHLATWKNTAAHIRDAQLRSIYDGAIQVLSRPGLDVDCVVTAGIGAPIAAAIANRLGLPSMTFGALVPADDACRLAVTRYAPAAAVALLNARG
ncbi:MAG: hypothetical protein IKE66_08475 [Hyphomicrobium sp.]|nr:hypothetical protein [Hyphomicrobium sp.]